MQSSGGSERVINQALGEAADEFERGHEDELEHDFVPSVVHAGKRWPAFLAA